VKIGLAGNSADIRIGYIPTIGLECCLYSNLFPVLLTIPGTPEADIWPGITRGMWCHLL